MTTQSPSTLVASDIDLGGAIVYFSDTAFDTFTNAIASTKWRKIGLLKEGVQLDVTREVIEFFSGFPARLQKQYVSAEDVRLSGQILETNVRNIARVLGYGDSDLTVTLKTTSPAPATSATGSTKTSIVFDDITGFAVDDQIKVGNQYGRIKTIDTGTDTATLYEGLSGDATPSVGDAISKVDTIAVDFGALTNPRDVAMKISHTMPGGYGSYEIIVLKAQMTGNITALWGDNTQTPDSIGIPFELRAIADPDVESGKTARWISTQS